MHSASRRFLIVMLPMSLALAARVAAGPATQPADSSADRSNIRSDETTSLAWPATLAAFASTLVDARSDAAIEPFLADAAIIRQFNRPQQETVASLRECTSHATTILATRAYPKSPDTFATDLAADIKKADLPDCVKRRLTPGDDKDSRRANATAGRWISESLLPGGASDDEPVGVIVLWRPLADDEQASADNHADDNQQLTTKRLPFFVLVRAEQSDGRYRIRQICFGEPLPMGGD